MTDDSLSPIRSAIASGDADHARALIREELQYNPTADVYYLAYQVALNEYQQRKFLNQALALDPFHSDSESALKRLEAGESSATMSRPFDDDPFSDVSNQAMTGPISVSKPKRTVTAGGFPSEPTYNVDASDPSATHSYELAGFGQRFGAWLLDVFILFLAVLLLIGVSGGFSLEDPNSGVSGSINVIAQLLSIAFHVYFLTQRDGQTPGKMAVGIRVIKKNGSQLSILDAFLRNVVGYNLSGFVLGLGYFWSLWDSESQTWHDKIVSTVVVKV